MKWYLTASLMMCMLLPQVARPQIWQARHVLVNGAGIASNNSLISYDIVGQALLGLSAACEKEIHSGFWNPADFPHANVAIRNLLAPEPLYLYPVPARDLLFIHIGQNSDFREMHPVPNGKLFAETSGAGPYIEIYSLKGTLVQKHVSINEQCINISSLTPGLYFLRLRYGNTILTGKFVTY